MMIKTLTSEMSLCIQMFLTSSTVTRLRLDTPWLASYSSYFWAALILENIGVGLWSTSTT